MGPNLPAAGKAPARSRARSAAAYLRRHPVIVGAMVVCTLAGAALGVAFLTQDWSLARRVAAGAISGAGVGLLVTFTKMIG